MEYEKQTLSKKDFASTLAKGLAVLESFSGGKSAMTISEVAKQVGIHRAIARRLLLTLVELNYLKSDGHQFRLTNKIFSFSQEVPPYAWQKITADVLSLSNRFNESCSVSILEGLNIRFVIRDPTRRMFSSPLSVGDQLPAYCSAAGKVLMASLEKAVLRKRIADLGPLLPRTHKTIVKLEKLEQVLQSIRQNGWAMAEDELEEGTIAIAVPLFDSANNVIAALAMGTHKMRRSTEKLQQEFLPIIQNAAEQMSNHLAEITT